MPPTAVQTVAEDYLQRNGAATNRNVAGNPNAVITTTGYGTFTNSGTQALTRTADTSLGGTHTAVQTVTGTTGLGVSTFYGPLGVNSFSLVASRRYAFRAKFKLQSLTGPAIQTVRIGTRLIDNGGQYVNSVLLTSPSSGGAREINNPTVGTVYDLVGYIDSSPMMTANPTATGASFNIEVIQANGQTYEIRYGQILMTEIGATTTVVPAYFDGDVQYANWEGAANASPSVLYTAHGLPTKYTIDSGSTSFWINSLAKITSPYNQAVIFYPNNVLPAYDQQVTARYTMGANGTQSYCEVLPKRVTGGNYLRCWTAITGNGNVTMAIYSSTDFGAGTLISSLATVPHGIAAGASFWLQASVVGDVVDFRLYKDDPTLASSTPWRTLTVTLTGTFATNYGRNVKGYPAIRLQFADTSWTHDRFDVIEFTRARYWTGTTKKEWQFASRIILPAKGPRALIFWRSAVGDGAAPRSVWEGNAGWDTTIDTTGDQNKASIISKVLSGSYKTVVFDRGYYGPSIIDLETALDLYNTYGVSIFISGNDLVSPVTWPLWTGSQSLGAGALLNPVVGAAVEHPIARGMAGAGAWTDTDSRSWPTGIRSSVVVVGEAVDTFNNSTRRPAVLAEENPNGNGARIIISVPYNWYTQPAVRNAFFEWIERNDREASDIIYGDSDNQMTESDVAYLTSLGVTLSDSPAVAAPLNFRRFLRTAQAGVYDSVDN